MVSLFFNLGDKVVDVVEEVELQIVVDLICMSADEVSITICATVFYPYSEMHFFIYVVRCR